MESATQFISYELMNHFISLGHNDIMCEKDINIHVRGHHED